MSGVSGWVVLCRIWTADFVGTSMLVISSVVVLGVRG